MVKVAVEAINLQQHPLRGAGRVLANVLARLPDRFEVHLLADSARSGPAPAPGQVHRLGSPAARRIAFHQLAVPRWLAHGGVDVFHGPFHALPFRQHVPMVVTIHDTMFVDHPEWYPRAQLWSFRVQARHALRTATVVLTVSRHVGDVLTERFGVPADRIVVAPNGIEERYLQAAGAGPALPREDSDPPYLLALGGSPKRNAPLAVAVWRELRRRGHEVELVLLNEPDTAEPGLRTIDRPDDDTVAALLAGARLLLYPTGYEGFGLPALEAAAVGTPVVCGRVGALPEVLGDAGAWADRLEATALADVAERVLVDDAWAADRRRAGRERALAVGGWDAAVAGHVEAYDRAAAM